MRILACIDSERVGGSAFSGRKEAAEVGTGDVRVSGFGFEAFARQSRRRTDGTDGTDECLSKRHARGMDRVWT